MTFLLSCEGNWAVGKRSTSTYIGAIPASWDSGPQAWQVQYWDGSSQIWWLVSESLHDVSLLEEKVASCLVTTCSLQGRIALEICEDLFSSNICLPLFSGLDSFVYVWIAKCINSVHDDGFGLLCRDKGSELTQKPNYNGHGISVGRGCQHYSWYQSCDWT